MSAMAAGERAPGGARLAASWRRASGLILPLSWRSVRRRKAAAALTALSLALGVATFLLFGGYFAATRKAVEGRIVPLALPADLVVTARAGSAAGAPSMVQALNRLPDVKTATGMVVGTAYTSVGRRRIAGLDEKVLGGLKLAGGAVPKTGGEVLLSQSLAAAGGIKVGNQITVATDVGGVWREQKFLVSGLYQGDDFFEGPVARREALAPLGLGPADNAALVEAYASSSRPGVASRITGLYQDAVDVFMPESPASLAGSWLGQAFSPGNVAVFMVFAFSGLGVMNVLLLSFLQRKRQMGVFKALGMDDRDLKQLFFGEGLYVAVAGAALGMVLTAALVPLLGSLTGARFIISGGLAIWALVLSFAVFALAAWLPAMLCQRASVSVLLQNKRIYLDPKISCAECGRCGGF